MPLEFNKFPISSIVDQSEDVIIFVTPDGIITDWNASAERLYGYTKPDVLGKPIWHLAPPDEQQTITGIIDKARSGVTVAQHELKHTGKEGKEFYISLNIAPVTNAEGDLAGLIGIARDITQRKKTEDERNSHRIFLDNIQDTCFECDLHGKCTLCNEAAYQLLGYTREEYLNLSHHQRYRSQAAADKVFQIYNNAFKTRNAATLFESEVLCKDGSTITMEMVVSPIFDGQTIITGFRNVGRDITDREKKQAELERYRDFIENVNDSCFESDLNGTLTYANEATARGTGYTRTEIIGMNHRDYSRPVESSRIYKAYNKVFKTGNPETITDYEVLNKDGQSKFLDVSASLVRDTDGRPVGFRGISRDVTENKKVLKALKQSEERYHNLFEYSKAVMLLIDSDTADIVDANRTACAYYGYTKEELLLKKISDISTLSREDTQEEMHRATLEQRSHFYFQHRLANGAVRPVEVFTGPIEVDGKRLIYSIIHDISERRQAEEALIASEEKYRSIIQNMLDAYFENDLAGRFTFANDIVCTTVGYSLDELLQMDYRAFTTPDMAKKVRDVYRQIFQTGIPGTLVDYEIICRDGTRRIHQLNVSLMRDRSGNPLGFRTVSRDITERKEAEKELRQSEEKYRSILENMTEGYFESDTRGYITFANDAGCKILGYPREELSQLHYSRFTTPEAKKRMQNAYQTVFQTGLPSNLGDYQIICKDGTIRIHQLSIVLMRDAAGNKVGFRAVARDITEKKKAEEELHQSDERIQTLFDNMPVPTVVWKDEKNNLIMTQFNDAALQYTNGKIIENIGKTVEECYPGAQHVAFDMHQCFALRSNIEKSFWFNDGSAHENKYVTIKYAFAPPDNIIMHIIDTTAQKRAEENLKYISVHDALTGLYNRFYSDAEITRINASRLRPVSFIIIDLNDLKMINDRKGHAAGDLYIKNTATLLKQTFRPEDMIARIGGDEFIIMLPLVDEDTCTHALARLKDNLDQFNRKADQPISMASGFATSHTSEDVDAVIAEADRMMYEEKSRIKIALKTMAGG